MSLPTCSSLSSGQRCRSKFSLSRTDWLRQYTQYKRKHSLSQNDNAEHISVLGVGKKDHLRWEKLCGPCERAQKRNSVGARVVPEASFCICDWGLPHPSASVHQQPAPRGGVGGGDRESGDLDPTVRCNGSCCGLRSVPGHDRPGHPGWLQVQRFALDSGESVQHLLPRQRVHPQRAHPWPGERQAVAEGERPAAAERLHLANDLLHPLSDQLHQRDHQPGGGGPHPHRDPERSVGRSGARRAAGRHRKHCSNEL